MKTDEIMELVLDYADERKYGRTGQADAKPVRTAIEALVVDAERYQFMKNLSRAFSLDINGNHPWMCQITRDNIRGPTLDAAIDAALEKRKQ